MSIIEAIKEKLCNANFMGAISQTDLHWLLDVLDRRPDSLDYILDLALMVEKTVNFSGAKYVIAQYQIQKELNKLKTFFFKQQKILIAVPQRQRHPKFAAPNLGGLVIPQNYRIKGEVCYGMKHAEARNWLVEKALEDPEITSILFVDDDILLPLDAITKLADANEMIIGANYIKKQYPEETCALEIGPGPDFHNQEIKAIKEDMTPRPVTQMGMGACLINTEVFKKIEKPWFEFIYNKDGSVYVGEDCRLMQKAIIKGIIPKIIPGLVPVHVDFKTGKHYGPHWLVQNDFIRKEYIDKYCFFQCDAKECYV